MLILSAGDVNHNTYIKNKDNKRLCSHIYGRLTQMRYLIVLQPYAMDQITVVESKINKQLITCISILLNDQKDY